MSQAELGRRIGMTPSQMTRLLSGERQLKSREADLIRSVFNVPLETPTSSDPVKRRFLEIYAELSDSDRAAVDALLDALARRPN